MKKSEFMKHLRKIKSYELEGRWIKFQLIDGVLDHCILFKKGKDALEGKSVLHIFKKYPKSPDWAHTPTLEGLDFLSSYFLMLKEFCKKTVVPSDDQERIIESHVKRHGNIKLITLLKILYGPGGVSLNVD